MKRLFPILIMLALIATACSPNASVTPTPDMISAQQTAIVLAWTFAAGTQTAMPTATPLPPTETPSPTLAPTMTLMPTIDPITIPTATSAGGGDPCNVTLSGWSGPEAKLLISNEVKGTVNLSLYLNETAFACGYVYANFSDKGQTSMTVPYGCYTAYGWVTTKKGENYTVSAGGLCINNPDKWTLIIRDQKILFLPP